MFLEGVPTMPTIDDKKLIIDFSKYYSPFPRQMEAHKADARYVLGGGALGGGKASSLRSMIQTPEGSIEMGDIKIGQKIWNPDGSVVSVIATWPQGNQPLYRICLGNGSTTLATSDHLWPCVFTDRVSNNLCVLKTSELIGVLYRGERVCVIVDNNGHIGFGALCRIKSIEYYGVDAAQCITVDHPNGLYLTDDFIVTHNSRWLCAEGIQLSLDFPNNRGYLCRHENVVFKKTTLLTLLAILPEEALVKHDKQDQYFEFINGSRMYYGGLRPTQSEKPLDRIKSLELGWFGIDEASETTREFFLMLTTRLRLRTVPSSAYRGLLTSNPEPGWIKQDFIDEPMPGSKFVQFLPRDNPGLPDDYEEQMRKAFGSTPGWVERYLEGDWNAPMASGGLFYVFPWAMIRQAYERDDDPTDPTEMGIDVARTGVDKTVIYLRRGTTAMLLLDDHISDTMMVVERARRFIEQYEPETVRVDAIGIGAGVYDRLAQLFGRNRIVEFIAGGKAVESERFYNARSEAIWLLRERAEKGELSIPNDAELHAQMSGARYMMRSDKKIAIESKEDMRKRGMRSPDKLDALALAFGGGRPPEVAIYFG
jgi:hypothetical protein